MYDRRPDTFNLEHLRGTDLGGYCKLPSSPRYMTLIIIRGDKIKILRHKGVSPHYIDKYSGVLAHSVMHVAEYIH